VPSPFEVPPPARRRPVCCGSRLGAARPRVPAQVFAHATHFLGHKVVLLGRFNAQGLASQVRRAPRWAWGQGSASAGCRAALWAWEVSGPAGQERGAERLRVLVRTTPGREYVKAVLFDGRLVGAVRGAPRCDRAPSRSPAGCLPVHALTAPSEEYDFCDLCLHG